MVWLVLNCLIPCQCGIWIEKYTFFPTNNGSLKYSSHKGPVKRSFNVFFDARLIKRFNKQWSCRWFQTPWRSYDVTLMMYWFMLSQDEYFSCKIFIDSPTQHSRKETDSSSRQWNCSFTLLGYVITTYRVPLVLCIRWTFTGPFLQSPEAIQRVYYFWKISPVWRGDIILTQFFFLNN